MVFPFPAPPQGLPRIKKPTTAYVYSEGGHYYAVDEHDHTICYDSPTDCIQEAINYVLSKGGGTVELGPGDYYFEPINTAPSGNALIQVNLSNYTWSSFKLKGQGYGTRIHLPVNNTPNAFWQFEFIVP